MSRRHFALAGFVFLLLASCSSNNENDACVRNSQCPASYVCDNGLCVEMCEFDIDCESGETCRAGYCVPGGDAGDDATADVGTDAPDLGQPTGIGPDGQPVYGANAGETCAEEGECRSGLTCAEELCSPAGDTEADGLCTISGECAEGLSCNVLARCVESAQVEAGGICDESADCAAGLRCELLGVSGVCAPEGVGDLGQTCTSNSDCFAPLVCDLTGSCQILAFAGVPLYDGTECAERDDSAEFRVFFEVPTEEPPAEFFRLPYPNDIRRTSTGVDLSGFPTPGAGVLAGDLISAYVDAIESGGRGFSTNPTIFLRFSKEFSFESIRGGGEDPTLYFVNVDPDSDNYGHGLGMSWFMTNGRGNFICHNYVAVRSNWNSPLEHDTTYAVYLTTGVESSTGEEPSQDADLLVELGAEEPEAGPLRDAWNDYQPFRDYLDGETISSATIAGAAVFTTMDPDKEVIGIRDAIRARTVPPALEDVTLCADGISSPCDDRACLNPDEGYLEVHAVYRAPIYQNGDRPYLTPEDGGAFVFDDDMRPESAGAEEMCLSMAIPDEAMPDDGWPVVLYAHGTGGDFLSHMRNGPAADLSDISLGEDTVRFVTVSIDGVQHGPRRGASELDPEILFFNFGNPAAAMGNMHQGVADYFYLTWLLEQVDISADDSPTGEQITFDGDNFFFFGHSQGAMIGVPFVANESHVRGAVLSGAGGSLVLSLLNKQNPVDISSAVQFVLNEDLGDNHPVLNLLQQFIDPVDPLNYGKFVFRTPYEGGTPTHVLQTYGLGDTYTPDRTQEVLGAAMGIQLADPPLREVSGIRGVTLPASGNRRTGEYDVTAVMLQFEPEEGEDGHFVAFRNADARRQLAEFLGTAVNATLPTVSP